MPIQLPIHKPKEQIIFERRKRQKKNSRGILTMFEDLKNAFTIHRNKQLQFIPSGTPRKAFTGQKKRVTRNPRTVFSTPLAAVLTLLLILSQSASIIGGFNVATGRDINMGLAKMTQAAKLDGYQLRYNKTTRGQIVFTGNALGLNTFQNVPGYPINGSIDTFTTTDPALQTQGFPSGTTKDWTKNSSMAVADVPNDSLILYAELIWGGNYKNISNTLNIQNSINTPVKLTTPDGSHQVTPNPATASETDYGYIRTADVTEFIKAGGGNITVGGVPGIIDPLDKSGNYVGWTLAVVYSKADLPIRNLSLYTGSESVFTNREDGNTVSVKNFGTPLQGDFGAKLWISTQEGDSDLTGDQLLFGATQSTMQPISGANNKIDNFFAAQINKADGNIDTRGTFGIRNQDIGTSQGGRRHGFDITAIDVTDRMTNGQTEAYIKGTSSGDIYVINALGVQIDVNAPNPIVTIERDKEFVKVGQTIKYDIEVTNDGVIDGKNPTLNSLIPEGTALVPGSFKINGQDADKNPANPIEIEDIKPGETQTYSYIVRVNSLPPSGVFENEAFVSYEYTPVAGSDVVKEDTYSSKVVTFPLQPVGLPPVAVDDAGQTEPNTPITLPVSNNDTDPDDNLSVETIVIKTQPQHGTATVNTSNGESTYTPNQDYKGTDSYVYTICDDEGLCDDATVTITIEEKKPPVADNDSATTKQGTPVNIPILTNDTDPLNEQIAVNQITVTEQPEHGTVSMNNTTKQAVYTPNDPNFKGQDIFKYKLCNTDGCDDATVTITISEKILPQAQDDTANTKTNKPVTIPILSNDTPGTGAQFDLPTLKVIEGKEPQHGEVTINPSNGEAVYTPDNNFTGQDTFEYTICNNQEECDTAKVTVTIVPVVGPDAKDDNTVTDQDTPVTVTVLSNDVKGDAPLKPDTVTIIDQPTHGTATVNTDGKIVYTPNPGYSGNDTLLYEVCDENEKCDSATVTISIDQTFPPTANPDTATTLKNEPVEVGILTNDTNPLNTPNTVKADDFSEITVAPAHGTAVFNPTTSKVLYTPNADYVGSDTFKYEICNEDGCSETIVSVNINTPEAPDAVDDLATTMLQTPVNIPVLTNDTPGTDRELDPSSLTIKTPPTHGTAIIDTVNNTVRYTPAQGYTGTDTLTYTICNDKAECDNANVLITVTPPPMPNAVDDSATTPQNQPVLIPILKNDQLPEGTDPAQVTFLLNPVNGTITYNPTAGVTYTPANGFTGEDRFIYKICTQYATCDSAEVKVTVTPLSAPINPPQRGQVLGAKEVVAPLPRTGGEQTAAINFLLMTGLLIASGFFISLYFIKTKNN